MKLVGFTELVYGEDYLAYALRSAMPAVDEYFVAYSEEPLNRRNPYQKPDDYEHMKDLAHSVASEFGKQLTWYENPGNWGRYDQRHSVLGRVDEGDIIILTDADEVWRDAGLQKAIDMAIGGTVRFYRVDMYYHWRSFDHICRRSGELPLRLTNTAYEGKKGKPCQSLHKPVIHEFGFARSPRDMAYKMPSHGHYHKDDSSSWFHDRWLPWTPEGGPREYLFPEGDGSRFRELQEYDKMKLPEYMREHPYWDETVIGGHEVRGLKKR
jgi:hypothetical protein